MEYSRFVLYPDKCVWTEKVIRGHLADLIADMKLDGELEGTDLEDIDPQTVDIEVACDILTDTGEVTFAKEGYKDPLTAFERQVEREFDLDI